MLSNINGNYSEIDFRVLCGSFRDLSYNDLMGSIPSWVNNQENLHMYVLTPNIKRDQFSSYCIHLSLCSIISINSYSTCLYHWINFVFYILNSNLVGNNFTIDGSNNR